MCYVVSGDLELWWPYDWKYACLSRFMDLHFPWNYFPTCMHVYIIVLSATTCFVVFIYLLSIV